MGRRAEGWKLHLDERSGIYGVRWTRDGARSYVSTGARDPGEAARAAASIYARRILGTRKPLDRGRIYFVQAGDDGPIKIGFAQHLETRLAGLRTDSPVPLVLRCSLPGTRADEKAMHRRFGDFWLRGEWFNPEPALVAFIAAQGGSVDGDPALPRRAPGG
jgi:hypothetical protein